MGKRMITLVLAALLMFHIQLQAVMTVQAEELVTYTISFDFAGGAADSGENTMSIQVTEGMLPDSGEVSAIAPIRKGYQFQGWADAAGKTYTLDQPVTEDVSLTAQWKPISYKVRFDKNKGKGTMKALALSYDKKKKLPKNQFTRKGYVFTKWNTKKSGKGASYKNKQNVLNLTTKDQDTVTLYAMWKGVPYKIKYKGNKATSGSMKSSRHYYGEKRKLRANTFKKKGYQFVSWNTKKNGKGKKYKDQAAVKSLTAKKNKVIVLYAQWKRANYTIKYHTNGGKITSSKPKQYHINTKTFLLPTPVREGYDFDGWYKDKKWKHRVSKIKQGSAGNLSLYAKWVKCTRKPKADAAKITKCRGTKVHTVQVKASVSKRIASENDYYYLIYVDPIDKSLGKAVAKTYKKKSISFTLNTEKNQGYTTSMFGIAVKKDGVYHLISAPSFVKKPEKAAGNQMAYQAGKTKKGIQLYKDVTEIHTCNVNQYFVNLTVSSICENPTVPYHYNGKTYYFSPLEFLQNIARECNKNKVTLTVQILLDWREGQIDLINPKARIRGVPYYSWNIYEKQSRERMEAMFCYLGMVFSQKDCYVSNWILGNEVNHPDSWNCAGSMSTQEYFETYAYTFRSLYYGIKSQYANAHIFICTDNYWSPSSSRRYSARQLVTDFPQYLDRIQKGLNWNLAYHAYSFPLTDTRFWNGSGTTSDVWSTPSITMNNIHVLTDFIRQRYGASVRVILSEQGFSSVPGQRVQAAALAYGYYIAACNPMIDAFIIRSYDDHPVEVAMGLRMGIAGKEAFSMFQYMDTKDTAWHTNRYLGVIGASSWGQIVPGFQEERLWKMYRETK